MQVHDTIVVRIDELKQHASLMTSQTKLFAVLGKPCGAHPTLASAIRLLQHCRKCLEEGLQYGRVEVDGSKVMVRGRVWRVREDDLWRLSFSLVA